MSTSTPHLMRANPFRSSLGAAPLLQDLKGRAYHFSHSGHEVGQSLSILYLALTDTRQFEGGVRGWRRFHLIVNQTKEKEKKRRKGGG